MHSNDTALAEVQPQHWQTALQNAVKDPAELLALLQLPEELLPAAKLAAKQFPLRVPRGFVARMQSGDPHDPLLAQVLPLGAELIATPGFSTDPVGDTLAKADAGIIHKYNQRALLISTGACAVHCRYCFRRHFPYADEMAAKSSWQHSLQWLKQNPDINEVILSGGDPLSLTDAKLAPLMDGLAALPQIHTLRLHSRQPVVLPERVTEALIHTLKRSKKQIVLVIHSNHANELDQQVADALNLFHQAGIHLLNQAVLLKGVNDHAEALISLSRRLFSMQVMPYYLHLLDTVQGAAHFEVKLKKAKQIHKVMCANLPGYLVPRLVKETAGEPNKTLVT
ncbi:MAG: EF-P beta-lysylation protein EpmB [Gammaproteobacteria bacterium]|nr:EF-P beta-lysylation protein EpmB [Gammaproteobacteria bacterium]